MPGYENLGSAATVAAAIHGKSPKMVLVEADVAAVGLEPITERTIAMGMTLHATSTMLHKHDTAHGASTQYGSIKNSLVALPKSLSQQVMQLEERQR